MASPGKRTIYSSKPHIARLFVTDQQFLSKTSALAAEECLVTIAPDYKGRIGSINSTLFTYDYIGSRVLQRSHYVSGGNINVNYAYDNLGRVTNITANDGSTDIIDFDYTYAAGENNIADIAFNHRTSTPSNDFVYDGLDRLSSVEYLDVTTDTEEFDMDLLGNRNNVDLRDNSTETYAVDDATNRYDTIGTDNIYYDDAGNLLARADSTDSNGYIYYYDYENRLAKITRWNEPTETTIVTYTYDALGRRIKMVDAITAANSRYYYFSDNWQVLEEYSVETTPAIEAYYVWGNYLDELLFIWNAGNQLAAHALQDHLFSTVALVDVTDGTVLERYEYNAYGKATVYTDMNDWQTGTPPTTQNYSEYGNPYLFTGRRLDKLDSGSFTTYYYRNRYYNADTGRFLQKDPLDYVDGMNLYECVRSNPVDRFDPFGLELTYIVDDIFKPSNPYDPIIRASKSAYNTVVPDDMGYVRSIKRRTWVTIRAGIGMGKENAAMFLNHFAGNSGQTKRVDLDAFFTDDPRSRSSWEQEMIDASTAASLLYEGNK